MPSGEEGLVLGVSAETSSECKTVNCRGGGVLGCC